jgi:hypothetical protein
MLIPQQKQKFLREAATLRRGFKHEISPKENAMTSIQKRIISIMLVACTISTILGIGSSLVCDYLNARAGISIEAILAEGK